MNSGVVFPIFSGKFSFVTLLVFRRETQVGSHTVLSTSKVLIKWMIDENLWGKTRLAT